MQTFLINFKFLQILKIFLKTLKKIMCNKIINLINETVFLYTNLFEAFSFILIFGVFTKIKLCSGIS